MANITKYLEKELLEHSVGKSTFTMPTQIYVGLFTSTPNANYTSAAPNGTEVTASATNYARRPISLPGGWNAAVDNNDLTYSSKITNSADISWPDETGLISGNWGEVKSIGIFDAPTSGNLLWFGPLSTYVSLSSGDTFTIPSGNITLTLG